MQSIESHPGQNHHFTQAWECTITCPHHSSPLHHCLGPVGYFLHCTFSQYYSTIPFSPAIPCKPCLPCFNLSCSLLMAQNYCFQQLWVSFNSCYFCFLMCSESAFPAIHATGRNLDLKWNLLVFTFVTVFESVLALPSCFGDNRSKGPVVAL